MVSKTPEMETTSRNESFQVYFWSFHVYLKHYLAVTMFKMFSTLFVIRLLKLTVSRAFLSKYDLPELTSSTFCRKRVCIIVNSLLARVHIASFSTTFQAIDGTHSSRQECSFQVYTHLLVVSSIGLFDKLPVFSSVLLASRNDD